MIKCNIRIKIVCLWILYGLGRIVAFLLALIIAILDGILPKSGAVDSNKGKVK